MPPGDSPFPVKYIIINEAANETNYTGFRVECLSYNEEFWKLCEMKWRCSVAEVTGQKRETPQSRYFVLDRDSNAAP
jgi:hypothetical protein